MYDNLKKLGVSCTLILDSAIGYVMEQVDMVMVGAEGVAESGGIINKIGTYTLAMCAKEIKKPLYVLTESFKFSRIYPLNQIDLSDEFKVSYFSFFLTSLITSKQIIFNFQFYSIAVYDEYTNEEFKERTSTGRLYTTSIY